MNYNNFNALLKCVSFHFYQWHSSCHPSKNDTSYHDGCLKALCLFYSSRRSTSQNTRCFRNNLFIFVKYLASQPSLQVLEQIIIAAGQIWRIGGVGKEFVLPFSQFGHRFNYFVCQCIVLMKENFFVCQTWSFGRDCSIESIQ